MYQVGIFLGLLAVSLVIYSLVDISAGRLKMERKTLWFAVVIFLPILGPLLYYYVKKKHQY